MAHLQTIRAKKNYQHVTRFYQHAVGLRSDDVTPRGFVLHELPNLGFNFPFFKWKTFLTPYSVWILPIYKQSASSSPTNYVVSTAELMTGYEQQAYPNGRAV